MSITRSIIISDSRGPANFHSYYYRYTINHITPLYLRGALYSSSDIMDPSLMPILLKRNAEDMQGYLKGLDSWEDDMKKRDQLLKKQKPILKKVIKSRKR